VLAWVAALRAAARGARAPGRGSLEAPEPSHLDDPLAARGTVELALRASNERVKQLNRMLRTTWSVSQLIARAQDRKQLLEGACRIFVEEGGLPSAWVGIANFETGAVLIDATAIMNAAELTSWVRCDDTPGGRGPYGRAVRSGERQVVQDLLGDPTTQFFKPLFDRYGQRAAAAFPLRERGKIVGAITFHAAEVGAFNDEVLALLEELTRELGLALDHLHDVGEHRSAEAALKETEAKLIVADRLGSVGRLAAGVAHEINNPLAYVVMNTTVALEQLQRAMPSVPAELRPVLEEVVGALGEARAGSERVRLIVRDLKLFSRANADSRGPADVNAVLESSINVAWHEIRHRARLVKDFGLVPEVQANESRLGQVFLNLLINAAHAIEPGNERRNEVRLVTRLEGNQVIVEVRDTGSGISSELQKKIFDPFFTTKPTGVGTGLGLAICHSIISELGGELSVESAPGKGSTFSVVLPIASESARIGQPQSSGSAEVPVQTEARARLLVVDDEPAVGNSIRRALSSEHDVVTSTSGKAVLDLLAHGERFDVVLCDLMMPEMTGMDLHRALVRVDPRLAKGMIVMTGGAFSAAAQEFLDHVPNQRMEKPFDVQSLRAMVRNALR
jgi:signal transduction histidine kinase